MATNHESKSWLDGKHVVFGEVLEGYDIVDKVQNVPKGFQDRPSKEVKIAKSGELEMKEEASEGTETPSQSESEKEQAPVRDEI